MAYDNEVKDLIRRINAVPDCKVVSSGKHKKVMRRGQIIVDENGPLILSGSPSDFRWREMQVRRLVKAGVFKADPYKAGGTPTGEDGKTPKEREDEILKERRQQALRDRSERFRVRTAAVRADVEPVVAKLGGWSAGGSGLRVSDFVTVLQRWGRVMEPLLIPKAPGGVGDLVDSAWTASVNNLRSPDGTIGERWLPLFEAFRSMLLADLDPPNNPEEAALVFTELLRDAKGIGRTPPREEEAEAMADERAHTPPPVLSIRAVWPQVAKDALFWMARGADPEDRHKILDLAEEIAELAIEHDERSG